MLLFSAGGFKSSLSFSLCLVLFSQVPSLQLSIPSITTRGFARRAAPCLQHSLLFHLETETSDAERGGTRGARNVCPSHCDRAGDRTPLLVREQRGDEWPATCRAKGAYFYHLKTKVRLSLVFSNRISSNKKVVSALRLGFSTEAARNCASCFLCCTFVCVCVCVCVRACVCVW